MTPRRRAVRPTPASVFQFDYGEFEEWYLDLVDSFLEPARITFERLMREWLGQQLGDLDRDRIRVSTSRVKGATRLWTKMQREEYRSRISSPSDIPTVIDDLIGIRVTCNNNSDLASLRQMLAGLPRGEDQNEWMSILPDSEKRYVDRPKDSGYRAYHINLRTLLQTPDGWVPAIVELQARTLLQDGWGELTHEDTYKPGVSLPPLAVKLAKRMADLLSAVDDLAQDLRDELDRLAQAAVTDEYVQEPANDSNIERLDAEAVGRIDTVLTDSETKDFRSALIAETRRAVGALTKHATLAEVAQRVQAGFGTEITRQWGGFGSFSALVQAAVPGVRILSAPPGVVVPPGVPFSAELKSLAAVDDGPDTAPAVVRRLRRYDKTVPAVAPERLNSLLVGVRSALEPGVWNALGLEPRGLGIRELNALSKWVRDNAPGDGSTLPRQQADYLLKGLLFSGNLRPGLSLSEICLITEANIFARASNLGLVSDSIDDRESLHQWFVDAVGE